ncbi:hypothetical protein BJX62DRAFT_232612 [Aspergillus germanicus]
MQDSANSYRELTATYTYLIAQLLAHKIGFVNLSCSGAPGHESSSSRPSGCELPSDYDPLAQFGPPTESAVSQTLLLVNSGYPPDEEARLVREEKIGLVGFGRAFVHKPDVVTRIENGDPLAGNDWPY